MDVATQAFTPDRGALSGIFGSISIAMWIVVFSPQIIENFRRGSAEGLSLQFLIVWLFGDIFNLLGAILQGVLPTMVILAVYYSLADGLLILQCFYYRGFKFSTSEEEPADPPRHTITEATALLSSERGGRRNSRSSLPYIYPSISRSQEPKSTAQSPAGGPQPSNVLTIVIRNTFIVLAVCFAGVIGWWISDRASPHSTQSERKGGLDSESLQLDILGQVFGYLCAALYIASRGPQLLLNYRRKSTEGVSLFFFLFAFLGNLTYVLSIFLYTPVCQDRELCRPGEASAIYRRFILINASWILGGIATPVLDLGVFAQFLLYREEEKDEDKSSEAISDA